MFYESLKFKCFSLSKKALLAILIERKKSTMDYGLIGFPLAQSFAVTLHEMISERVNHPYSFCLRPMYQDALDIFLKEKNFKGVNVTLPYKETVIPYLDEINDKAKHIGAVNLILNKNKRLFGYNVDYYGMRDNILYHKINVRDRDCLILGTGGTSNTAYEVLSDLGAKSITKASHSSKPGTISYSELKTKGKNYQIILNATPIGMFPNNEKTLINFSYFPNAQAAIDVIYNPLRTIFISEAKQFGLLYATGLYMLVSQAVKTYEIFMGEKIDEGIVPSLVKELEKIKTNLVLIGMPEAGKTALAKEIANQSSFKFIDTNDKIEELIQMPISSYLKDHSIAEFRALEEQVISKVSLETHSIIATGNDIVLRDRNISRLKQNGILFFLDKPLKNMKPSFENPLCSSMEKMEMLFQQRYHLYLSYCDCHIRLNKSLKDLAGDILLDYENKIIV